MHCNCMAARDMVVEEERLRYRAYMGTRRSGPGGVQLALPPLHPWLRNVLLVLAGLWVAEMVLVNFLGMGWLYPLMAWSPSVSGVELGDLWQPITKYVLQGPAVFAVLLNLLMVYFFLPYTVDRFVQRDLIQVAVAVIAGCFTAGWLWAALSWVALSVGMPVASAWMGGTAMGLSPFIMAMIALFALANPDRDINLFFVVAVKGKWLLWLELGFLVIGFLAAPGTDSFEEFGAFGFIVGWWHLMGPGAQRRRFKQTGKKIEKELKFKVYKGGRQGGQGDGDEWIN
ncbi:MAG: hypothetical protein AB8H79_21255 [Myxococcota bacterium]